MQTFDTPAPIAASVELGVGDIRIDATERIDTTVDVRPSDPTKEADVAAAEQTVVEYANGTLTVRGPSGWRKWLPRRGVESIDVVIGLPAGSRVVVEAGVGALRTSGRMGAFRGKLGVGDVSLAEAGPAEVKTGFGDVTIDRVAGRAQIVTGSGAVRVERIDGATTVKNGNGDTWIGEVHDDVRVSAANGAITIDRAEGSVAAKSANGDVRIGEVARRTAVAQTAAGTIEVGVRDGVAAWLDLHTKFGQVRNGLDPSEEPGASEDAVEVRATTSYGDVVVQRVPQTA